MVPMSGRKATLDRPKWNSDLWKNPTKAGPKTELASCSMRTGLRAKCEPGWCEMRTWLGGKGEPAWVRNANLFVAKGYPGWCEM